MSTLGITPRCLHTNRRLGFAYFSMYQGCAWFWRCDRCGNLWVDEEPSFQSAPNAPQYNEVHEVAL